MGGPLRTPCHAVAASPLRSAAITSIGARILSLRVSSSTRQRFAIDTHIVDAPDETSARLRQLHGEGTIELLRTDVVDTELSDRQDPDHRLDLLRDASQYEERPGVAVWGHSRWGHSKYGSDEDSRELDELGEVLWPGYDRHGEQNRNRQTRMRDTMHLHTAHQEGCEGFITRDQELLRRSDAVRERFGLRIATPEETVSLIEGSE